MPEVSIFGKDPRICLIGPSSCRRTCEIGTTVSPASSRADRAAAVYRAPPYLWNRSPVWVTTWSFGIGPSTATLRLARLFTSFITNTSGVCRPGCGSAPLGAAACGPLGALNPHHHHLVSFAGRLRHGLSVVTRAIPLLVRRADPRRVAQVGPRLTGTPTLHGPRRCPVHDWRAGPARSLGRPVTCAAQHPAQVRNHL